MAGDWIKIEAATPRKIEVYLLAEKLACDITQALGCVVAFWCLYDQQVQSGNALSVTEVTLDSMIGVTGFTRAMLEVGWLRGEDGKYMVPNVDRHLSNTAKKRALNARRVAEFKSRSGNAKVTRTPLPREEKRREDIKTRAGQTARPLRGTRLPPDWLPGEGGYNFCREVRPELDPSEVFEHFKDYWNAQPGAKGVKLDWQATWRNWVRRETKPRR